MRDVLHYQGTESADEKPKRPFDRVALWLFYIGLLLLPADFYWANRGYFSAQTAKNLYLAITVLWVVGGGLSVAAIIETGGRRGKLSLVLNLSALAFFIWLYVVSNRPVYGI